MFLLIFFFVPSNVSIFFLPCQSPSRKKLQSFLIAKCSKSKSHAMRSGFYCINLPNHLPLFPKQCLKLSHIHEMRTSFFKERFNKPRSCSGHPSPKTCISPPVAYHHIPSSSYEASPASSSWAIPALLQASQALLLCALDHKGAGTL